MIKAPGCTFNCKGIFEPIKAKSIAYWIRDYYNIILDLLCLNEIKCFDFLLATNLCKVNSSFKWITSKHVIGKGGVTMGVKPSLENFIYHFEKGDSLVCISLSSPYNLDIIFYYAPCDTNQRIQLWQNILEGTRDSILCVDFDMVEALNEKLIRKGKV